MASNFNQIIKSNLHPRNKNREQYDLEALIKAFPELKKSISPNKYGVDSIDFSNPRAVKLLNKALLQHYYKIQNWEFSDDNLCPPIPGRADYIHYLADLLKNSPQTNINKNQQIIGVDIGTGASCIYPIIGVVEYDWQFIATDIDSNTISSAQRIIDANPILKDKIECRIQSKSNHIFEGILNQEESIDFTMCNPPFHASIAEAKKGTLRKVKNLSGKKVKSPVLNFSGNLNELVFKGGEFQFIANMIHESQLFSMNVTWFTTLVSKESNLKGIYKLLKQSKAKHIKTINMGTRNKTSRIIAWSYRK